MGYPFQVTISQYARVKDLKQMCARQIRSIPAPNMVLICEGKELNNEQMMISAEEIGLYDGVHLSVVHRPSPPSDDIEAQEQIIEDEEAHDCIQTVFDQHREVQALIGKMDSDFNDKDIKTLQLAFEDYNIPISFAQIDETDDENSSKQSVSSF